MRTMHTDANKAGYEGICSNPEHAKIRQQRDDLLAAAEAVEWVWVRNSFVEECPWCGGNRGFGHAETCIRQQAIRKAKGQA